MNNLKERMRRFAVIGLAAVLITAQVPQIAFGAEAEAGPVEEAQADAPAVEEADETASPYEESVSQNLTDEAAPIDELPVEQEQPSPPEKGDREAVDEVIDEAPAPEAEAEPEDAQNGEPTEDGYIEVESWEDLQAELGSANTDSENPTKIRLKKDVQTDESGTALTVSTSTHVVLDLNGHTIDRGLGSSSYDPSEPEYGRNVITVSGNLTLVDSSEGGTGGITGGYGYPTGGVWVKENACFTMKGGNITGNIEKFDYLDYAGGVLVDERAAFIMEGGTIKNNKCDLGNVGAGGVFVRGSFTMSGNSSIT
ncbi:MAG: hypothetical protein K5668_06415, partial [Lachnospiraceae bacterium]|nr:hypothetical protein [Lachnospiraceae bacterium]